jgi:hypothetical protein
MLFDLDGAQVRVFIQRKKYPTKRRDKSDELVVRQLVVGGHEGSRRGFPVMRDCPEYLSS